MTAHDVLLVLGGAGVGALIGGAIVVAIIGIVAWWGDR